MGLFLAVSRQDIHQRDGSILHIIDQRVDLRYDVVVEQLENNRSDQTHEGGRRGDLDTACHESVGLMSPAAWMASNAAIMPTTVPMKPNIGASAMNRPIQLRPDSIWPVCTEPYDTTDFSTASRP